MFSLASMNLMITKFGDWLILHIRKAIIIKNDFVNYWEEDCCGPVMSLYGEFSFYGTGIIQ